MSQNSQSEVQGGTDPKLQMEALIGEMRRMMKADMDQLHERMDRMENINRGQQHIPLNRQRRERAAQRPAADYIEEFNEEDDDEEYADIQWATTEGLVEIQEIAIARTTIWAVSR